MRAAPAVSVPCRRAGGWRIVHVLAVSAAAAALTAWALGHLQLTLWPAALAAAAAGAMAWRWARDTTVQLSWDGRQWTADDTPGPVDVMIDLGPWLLLRLRPPGGQALLWLPVSAADAGPALHGLRAALYSRPVDTAAAARSAAPRPWAEAV